MKTIMIFVKMHMWIGYSIDFNQLKYNSRTYSVFRGFKVF